jgi:protein AATF/BFR2
LPSVADAKYEGVRTSREQLLEDTDDSVFGGSDEEDEVVANNDFGSEGTDDDEMQSTVGHISATRLPDDEAPSEIEEAEPNGEHPVSHHQALPTFTSREESTEDSALGLKRMHDDDVKKGQAVKKQIVCMDLELSEREISFALTPGAMGFFIRHENQASKIGCFCQ